VQVAASPHRDHRLQATGAQDLIRGNVLFRRSRHEPSRRNERPLLEDRAAERFSRRVHRPLSPPLPVIGHEQGAL
jgi:hypothetical protein